MALSGEILYNPNPNPDQIFYVDGGQKTLIPPGGSAGGVSQANMITGLKNCGVVDKRTVYTIADQIAALEAIPWHPNSPTS